MQIKRQNRPTFEEDGNYAEKLETIAAKYTNSLRKNGGTANDNETR